MKSLDFFVLTILAFASYASAQGGNVSPTLSNDDVQQLKTIWRKIVTEPCSAVMPRRWIE